MKTINKSLLLLVIICLSTILLYTNIFAQKAIVVSGKVGILIDSTENFDYLLFTDYSFEEFIAAQVFEYPENEHVLKVYLKNDKVIEKAISKEEIKLLASKIRFFQNNYTKGDTSSYYTIYLDNGTVLNGKISSITNARIELNSLNIGQVNIPTDKILEIRNQILTELKLGERVENKHSSRYFFAPSAIPMEKGEGYFQDIYLLFVSANMAVSDYLTIGGGFSIIPGLGIDEQAFFINVKTAYQLSDKLYIGGGGLYLGVGGVDFSIGLGYVVGTYGSKDHNLTLGIGYGYESGELMNSPLYTVCGMTRLSKRISFITENWLGTFTIEEEYSTGPPDYYYDTREIKEFMILFSYGLRFFSDKISVDLAFMNMSSIGEIFFPGIPYIDFVVRF